MEKRNVLSLLLICIFTILLMTACGGRGSGGGNGQQEVPLLHTPWVLKSLPGQALHRIPSLSLDEASAYGYAGCNRYFSPYTLDTVQQTLRFDEIAVTAMLCTQDEIMQLERSFLTAIGATRGYRFEQGELVFLDADGTRLAVFSAASQES